MSENDPIHVGQVIASQFNILRKLGAGGMGAVYLAEQLGMDRKVVVKVMHPELTAGSSKAVERFKREAKAVAQLNHPNIVQVYVFGQTPGGQMYLAMEYIEGRDLTADLQRGALEQPRALKILDQVCSALIEAHAAGVVHRDLKPDNIMLTDRHGNPDYVKVLDFGIAKMADPGAAAITQAGAVFGTPRYMAPEQAKGIHIDARADIYALGVILYEMLTGAHPFRDATTALEYIVKHATEEIPSVGVDYSDLHITPRIDALLMRCLAKEPDARFQSARELQREVRLALRDFPEAARGFPTDGAQDGPAPVLAAFAPSPTGLAPTQTVPGSAAGASKKRAPAWVWAVIGVVVVGGAVAAAVLGSSGPTPGPDPIGAAAAATVAGPADAPDAGRVVAAGDPATRTAEAPPPTAPPAETDIAEGMPIDGFPIPARARITTSTPQVEMLETDLAGADVIAFYKAKLAGRYGDLQEIPNGLMIAGDKTPFSTISVMNGADNLSIILSRNALAKTSGPKDISGKSYFGVAAIDDASVIAKMDNVAVLRSRKSMREVCAFYTDRYSEVTGVVTAKDVEANPPYCNMAASADAKTVWQAIAVVDDPTSKGAIMISISAKQ